VQPGSPALGSQNAAGFTQSVPPSAAENLWSIAAVGFPHLVQVGENFVARLACVKIHHAAHLPVINEPFRPSVSPGRLGKSIVQNFYMWLYVAIRRNFLCSIIDLPFIYD